MKYQAEFKRGYVPLPPEREWRWLMALGRVMEKATLIAEKENGGSDGDVIGRIADVDCGGTAETGGETPG